MFNVTSVSWSARLLIRIIYALHVRLVNRTHRRNDIKSRFEHAISCERFFQHLPKTLDCLHVPWLQTRNYIILFAYAILVPRKREQRVDDTHSAIIFRCSLFQSTFVCWSYFLFLHSFFETSPRRTTVYECFWENINIARVFTISFYNYYYFRFNFS